MFSLSFSYTRLTEPKQVSSLRNLKPLTHTEADACSSLGQLCFPRGLSLLEVKGCAPQGDRQEQASPSLRWQFPVGCISLQNLPSACLSPK